MSRMVMSPAAAGLLRALIARSGAPRDRILLTDSESVDWQSLTFTGERHQLGLRIGGSEAARSAERLCAGLEDAEFSIPGVIVADVHVAQGPRREADGSVSLSIEALTVGDD
jgi:hypothetical protein